MYSKQNTDLLAIANGKYRAAIDSVDIQCTRRSKIDRRRMDRYMSDMSMRVHANIDLHQL